jgi:hypothetical protein
MTTTFNGTLDELKDIVLRTGFDGEWSCCDPR